jgi:Domain of unknown function (DUF4386)
MSSAATTLQIEGISPKFKAISPKLKARAAGVCYLICGMAYSYADGSVRGKLVVSGDAVATAHNIVTHAGLYQRGFSAELISALGYIAVTVLLYELLKPVSRSISLGAMILSLVGRTVQAVTSIFHLAPTLILDGDHYLTAFTSEQLQALALLSLKLRAQSASLYMVFFGWYCLLLGYLIFRSKFLPRLLGVFLSVSGLSYQLFLSPSLSAKLFHSVIMPAGMLGELSLILWLIIFGVNTERWKEQANSAGTLE